MATLEEQGGALLVLVLSALLICICTSYWFLAYIVRMKWSAQRRSCSHRSVRNPTNWPVVGMLPALLQNVDRIHDYLTDLLVHNGGTFEFRGPWFANMHMLFTCHPANINHILCKNFKNYPKGPRFQRIFDILGEGMVNVDSELWELHRKTTMPLMSHHGFRVHLETTVSEMVERGLFPFLDEHVERRTPFGLKEVFRRLAFDIACMHLLEKDPGTLGLINEGEGHPLLESLRGALNAILYRHVLPEWCWKMQKWVFGVDREKRLGQTWETFDEFLMPIIMERKQKLGINGEEDESNFSMLVSHINAHKGKSVKFLRDTFLTLIVAGSDTTGSSLTWLFWLLAKNPTVQAKILQELLQHVKLPARDDEGKKVIVTVEACQSLIYLHAAVLESLRLFPSVPLNHKEPVSRDMLPSGHVVGPNTKIIMPFYSTGRMASVWGQDCTEFKPERWITPAGGIMHQPSFKFPAFNAGPRSCIGREMALTVVKMVAATVILHYRYELVEPHRPVEIYDSIFLEMKHDLNVVFTRRR